MTFLANDGRRAGLILLVDPVKDSAAKAIAELPATASAS